MPNENAPRYLTVLSQYLCETALEDLPAAVMERARWLVADTLPLIAAGMQIGEMQQFAARQLVSNPQGDASIIGLGRRAAPNVSALLNPLHHRSHSLLNLYTAYDVKRLRLPVRSHP